jgi:phospholipase C
MAAVTPHDVLLRARNRIKHVVVLMLENRSFDHMLGFLDHPKGQDFPGLRAGEFPNPLNVEDPSDPTPAEGVKPAAEYLVRVDPPHGHASAKVAMNGHRWRHFRMNGFVTAHREKLSGNEEIAHIYWDRLIVLGVLVAGLLAIAIQNFCRLSTAGGWPRALAILLITEVVVFAGAWCVRRAASLAGKAREFLLGTAVAGVVLAATAQAAWHRLYHQWLGFAVTWVFVAALVVLLILQTKAKFAQKPFVPPAALDRESRKVMHCMAPSKIPVIAALAREFAVCTRWFSSVPGATWPNRQFLVSGTSAGTVDIEIGVYRDETVFDRLGDDSWRIYHDGMAQVMCYETLWDGPSKRNWYPMSDFYDDVAITGRGLTEFTFIEPNHSGPASNSQHPGNNSTVTAGSTDFERGEVLVWRIYEALRKNPDLFEKTLLLITYDEHGGLFDHEPPPRATPPGKGTARERFAHLTRRLVAFFVENKRSAFDFRSLGVRVPTILVSPWVETSALDNDTTYDHSSLIPSLLGLFPRGGEPLSDRAAEAPTFLHLLAKRAEPRRPMPVLAEPPLAAEILSVEAATAVAPPPPAPPLDPLTPVTVSDDIRDQLQALDMLIRPKVAADTPVAPPTAAESVPAGTSIAPPPRAQSTAELFDERAARSRGER